MPTILYVQGWPFHFYSNQGNPADAHPCGFEIVEEFEYNCAPRLRREVRQIVFEHFDRIVASWREHFGSDSC